MLQFRAPDEQHCTISSNDSSTVHTLISLLYKNQQSPDRPLDCRNHPQSALRNPVQTKSKFRLSFSKSLTRKARYPAAPITAGPFPRTPAGDSLLLHEATHNQRKTHRSSGWRLRRCPEHLQHSTAEPG